MMKLIDRLKQEIQTSKHIIKEFKIPKFLVKYVQILGTKCHFIEYYFCVLNALLSTISKHQSITQFTKRVLRAYDFIDLLNKRVINRIGFDLKLAIKITTLMGDIKLIDTIYFDTNNLETRKRAILFFYNLLHSWKNQQNQEFNLKFEVNKSFQIIRKYYLEMQKMREENIDFSDPSSDSECDSILENPIDYLRDNY